MTQKYERNTSSTQSSSELLPGTQPGLPPGEGAAAHSAFRTPDGSIVEDRPASRVVVVMAIPDSMVEGAPAEIIQNKSLTHKPRRVQKVYLTDLLQQRAQNADTQHASQDNRHPSNSNCTVSV